MERVIGLVVVLCLVLSATRAEEEAMSAVDLTEDTFKDKVPNKFITFRKYFYFLYGGVDEFC